MTKAEHEKLIDLLIEKGPRLRESGVLYVEVGNVKAQLAAIDPPSEALDNGKPEPEFSDPLEDPALYGNGVVPGFAKLRDLERDDANG